MRRLCILVAVAAGCQHNIKTEFPPGLEPLEDNPVVLGNDLTEGLMTQSTDSPYVMVYGRGYVLVAPAAVWAATKAPAPNLATCTTSKQTEDLNNEPDYEYSYLVHYTVNNIVTVQWDDQWRFGTVDGTPDDPTLAMVKHQKTQGSSFITVSEGTIELDATPDPNVTELSFVEHLNATGGSVSAIMTGVEHNYASLVAVAHGNPIPPCP
jgi:hypothetical protein